VGRYGRIPGGVSLEQLPGNHWEGKKPDFLTTDWLPARFGERRRKAQRRFADFVMEGMKIRTSPWTELKGQVYVGNESFVESLLHEIAGSKGKLQEVPKKQKFAGRPGLSELFKENAHSDKQENLIVTSRVPFRAPDHDLAVDGPARARVFSGAAKMREEYD
jgi:hypothetical protein